MYLYNSFEEKQRMARLKHLPNELKMRRIINYVDSVNPKAMEQFVIFMCWFSKTLGKERTAKTMQIVQKMRMSGTALANDRKMMAIMMAATKRFKKTQICDILDISGTTLNRWLKQAEELKIKTLSLEPDEYIIVDEFVKSFDTLSRARNLLKGSLTNDQKASRGTVENPQR